MRTKAIAGAPRLQKSVCYLLTGNVVYMACQCGVLICAVKLGSPEVVGQLSLAFAICAPIFLLTQLRLRSASATDAALEFAPSDYIALRLAGTVAAVVIVALVCALFHLSHNLMLTVVVVTVAKVFESGSDVLYGLSQHSERMDTVAISMSLRGISSLTGFALLMHSTHRLVPSLAALCLGWAIVFLLYDLPRAYTSYREAVDIHFTWLHKWHASVRLLWLTLPLGFAAMMMSFSSNMPRYFVEHSRGATELGIFSALSYLTTTGAVVVNSITEAVMPRVARSLAARNYQDLRFVLSQLTTGTLLLSCIAVAAAAIFGRPVLASIYKAEYAAWTGLFLLLMVAAALANMVSVCNYLLIAGRKTGAHLVSLALHTLGMLLSCIVCVPFWGATGAAVASIVASALQLTWCAAAVGNLMQSAKSQGLSLPIEPVQSYVTP